VITSRLICFCLFNFCSHFTASEICQCRATAVCVRIRDVTKFEFEFYNVQTSNVFSRFEIRRMFRAPCCRMLIHGKMLVPRLISYGMHRHPESRQTFCSQIQPITQTAVLNAQHNFCSVTCYTVLISTLLLLTRK